MTHISATRLEYLQISSPNFYVKRLFKLPHVLPELLNEKQTVLSSPMAEKKQKKKHIPWLLFFFSDRPKAPLSSSKRTLSKSKQLTSPLSCRYSRVLRGDLATKQGRCSCKRGQQGRCFEGWLLFLFPPHVNKFQIF